MAAGLEVRSTITGDAQSIRSTFQLCNTEATPKPLADLSVKYWFMTTSTDGQVVEFDYNPSSAQGVIETVSPAREGANQVLIVSWLEVTLAGNTCIDIQPRIHTTSFTDGYAPTGDWSYMVGDQVVNTQMPIYSTDQLVWGMEPPDPTAQPGTGGAPATATGGAPATATGGAPATGTGGAPATATGGAPATATGGAPATAAGGASAAGGA
jgi:hypothetical protein